MGNDIRSLIRLLAHGEDFAELTGVPCKVTSSDGVGTFECAPINGDAPFIGVRTQAAEDTKGVLIVPKIGSVVIVQPINETTGYIAMFSEVETIKFLDGSYGGLVKVGDLVEKINALENQVNDLLSTLQSVSIPLAPSGTYPFAPLFASFTPLVPTEDVEITNDKITHGTV